MLLPSKYISALKALSTQGLISMAVIDLETSPVQFWGWGTGEQYVTHKQVIPGSETKIITAQYINFKENKAKFLEWDWNGKDGGCDKSLIEEFTKYVNNIDIIIGQNSKSFDQKVMQERARQHRTTPVNIDFMLDTKTASSSSFRTLSHSLDYRSKRYGFGGKYSMEFQDWIDICTGKVKPSKKMIPYGLKDVVDTKKLFWLDLPYYNLPQCTVNKIIKLVDKFSLKLQCNQCAQRRQSRFEVDILAIKKEVECRRCGLKRKLTSKEKVLL